MKKYAWLTAAMVLLGGSSAVASEPEASIETSLLLERLKAAETRLAELEMKQESDFELLSSGQLESAVQEDTGYEAVYDKGFSIRSKDLKKKPFSLRINGRLQFRYVGFTNDTTSFQTNSGSVDVVSRNDFEIERGRLEFRGHFLDPNLKYYFNLDADTDDNHEIIFHDFWVEYSFGDALNVFVGKRKVAGSYEWLESSTTTRFADRSLATTFFRPDRSLGIWIDGKPSEKWYYQISVTNGFNSTDLEPEDVDNQFNYTSMVWYDAYGDVGKGYSDLKHHKELALRLGGAYTYTNINPSNEEAADVGTFSDGSNLVAANALAPGVQLSGFDLHLLSAFLVGKYRGWSVNAEFYGRWLQNFGTVGNTPSPINDVFTHGWYTDFGYFLCPETVELIGRVSQIDGLFGDSWEYAGGVNWFLNGTHKHKITFDATVLDGIPTGSSSPNFEVGQDGILYRIQYQAAF